MTQCTSLPARRICFGAISCTVLLSCLALIRPAAGQTPVSAAERAAIQDAYDQISANFKAGDISRCMAYLSADYTATDTSGNDVDREQTQQHYDSERRQIRTMVTRCTLLNFVRAPGGIWVDMRMHTSGTGEKRVLFAKVRGDFTADFAARDLWIDTPLGWRLKHRQTLLDQIHIHPG